jgi:hypothetical protein
MTIEQLENFINQCFSILSEDDFLVTVVSNEVVVQSFDELKNFDYLLYSEGVWILMNDQEKVEEFDSFKSAVKTLKKLS